MAVHATIFFKVFQFTPLREGRLCCGIAGCCHTVFQFTPLREGRLSNGLTQQQLADFNSRPSARGDACANREKEWREIFQFTPLREGRLSCAFLYPLFNRYFNSRPSARGDECLCDAYPNSALFQFTPLREGRRPFRFRPCRPDISIHAPPRGANLRLRQYRAENHFNSRPSARGDAKDMQFLQIFCSTLTNQHGLTIVPRNLSRLFW